MGNKEKLFVSDRKPGVGTLTRPRHGALLVMPADSLPPGSRHEKNMPRIYSKARVAFLELRQAAGGAFDGIADINAFAGRVRSGDSP